MKRLHHNACPSGHTLMELVVAMLVSAILLAGLASVTFIASQTAYTPTAAANRTQAVDVVNRISEELRYATLIIQQTPQILEFVVADRNADGTAEKIRYEWSGTPGDPLMRRMNSGAAGIVLDEVYAFSFTPELKPQTTAFTTTVDSTEQVLLSNTVVQIGIDREISSTAFVSNQIDPNDFPAVPADALYWNATRVAFYGAKSGSANETLLLQLRAAADPLDGPTSFVVGQASVAEGTLTGTSNWNTISFPKPIRGLAFHRRYSLVWAGSGPGPAAAIRVDDNLATGVFESGDAGASWQYMANRQLFGRIYGTITRPGSTHNVTRNYVTHVRLALQADDGSHARIDASVPLANSPELLQAYWRADFDRDPTTTDANGDAVADWAMTGGGTFDPTKLIGGIWYATGALETRPLSDFAATTIIEARCRNTSLGGNGAVLQVNADRQGGLYAPILVYVQRRSDGTQTLTLSGKSSDSAVVTLCSRAKLSNQFVRFRLTIVPQHDVVNLQINDEDQGTFTYPLHAPPTSTDRYLTIYADGSSAEFDSIDVRVTTNY